MRKWQLMRNAAIFGVALAFLGTLMAQPGRRDKGDAPAKGDKTDAAVDAWVKVLIEKLNDDNETVRSSARAALVGVGKPALPALKKLADGDGSSARAASRIINQIESGDGANDNDKRGGQGAGPGQGQ